MLAVGHSWVLVKGLVVKVRLKLRLKSRQWVATHYCFRQRVPDGCLLVSWKLTSSSLRFNGHFPGEPGLASVYWSKGWWKWWWQWQQAVVIQAVVIHRLATIQSASKSMTLPHTSSYIYIAVQTARNIINTNRNTKAQLVQQCWSSLAPIWQVYLENGCKNGDRGAMTVLEN